MRGRTHSRELQLLTVRQLASGEKRPEHTSTQGRTRTNRTTALGKAPGRLRESEGGSVPPSAILRTYSRWLY